MASALRVNPNRMELLKLKRRHQVALRGHKLLKDKLDELLKEFLGRISESRRLRRSVEKELAVVAGLYVISRAEAGGPHIDQALSASAPKAFVGVESRNVMSVNIPVFSLLEPPVPCCYSYISTPAVLDSAIDTLSSVLERVIELAQKEKAIELLAAEIERTRRRVNALEHVLIPQVTAAIRQISMKLDEGERANLVRLMKVKEIIAAQESAG
ncbi:MAG: V-type ATP synthase subunit D [Actinobacteria bacterium]|nr:V-type ATP synthase subunit D [Actinomycetota bacterium]